MGDEVGTDSRLASWRKRTRRRWSEAQRGQIVAASYAPGASMAAVARHYDINANLLWNWRRAFKQAGALPAPVRDPVIGFASVELVQSDRSAGIAVVGVIELSHRNGQDHGLGPRQRIHRHHAERDEGLGLEKRTPSR